MSQLVSIEGCDGAGKTTQAALLIERLRGADVDAELVREPGGTPLGEKIRRWVKGEAAPGPLAELLLFETARAELVAAVIQPALDRGAVVVTDRFTDSTLAYQGYGRGIDLDTIRDLNRIATSGLSPDVTILLDLAPQQALARLDGGNRAPAGGGRSEPADQRRFESQPPDFHERVAEGFRELARTDPTRWVVIDGAQPPEVVSGRIWSVVGGVLRR